MCSVSDDRVADLAAAGHHRLPRRRPLRHCHSCSADPAGWPHPAGVLREDDGSLMTIASAAAYCPLSTPVDPVSGRGDCLSLSRFCGTDAVFERVVTVLLDQSAADRGAADVHGQFRTGIFRAVRLRADRRLLLDLVFVRRRSEKSVALPDMPEDWWLYDQHYPFVVAVLLGGLTALVSARSSASRLCGLRGASFTIATFAFLHRRAFGGAAMGGSDPRIANGYRHPARKHALTMAAVSGDRGRSLIGLVFKESTIGLKLRASREDEDAAAAIGVNVKLMRWCAWTASAFFCLRCGWRALGAFHPAVLTTGVLPERDLSDCGDAR